MINTADIVLSFQDRQTYHQLFLTADIEKKSFLLKNEAMSFFSTAGIPSLLLEEIWQTVNQDKRDFITELEFYKALKLISCAQNGLEATDDTISTQVPVPQFGGCTIAEMAPITANEREAYIQVFQSCNPVDGLLYGQQAKDVFLRSNLPVDKLNAIWLLADTRNSGTLNKTEFIIAIHYISRLMKNPSLTLPTSSPSEVYAEATGRFASSMRRHNTMASPIALDNKNQSYSSPTISQMPNSSLLNTTEGSFPMIPPEEIERYSAYFDQLDCDQSGFIDAEEAVYFFSHSQLPDAELGRIWEIADSKHLGKLDVHDFGIAMHLISMRTRGESIDKYELVSHLHLQKQQVFSQQSSPALQNQQIQYTEDSNLRFELEHQMIEIKEQVNSEYKRVEEYRKQLQQEHQSIDLLEKEIAKIKAELEAAKMVAEDAEKILIEEQRTKEFLEASTMDASNLSSSRIENVPDLTRAPSTFSSSSIMSPRSEFGASTATSSSTVFDPFAGFKKMNSDLGVPSSPPVTVQNLNDSSIATIKSQLSLSPVQSKAISMYGFDITAFDALSFNDSNEKSTGYSQKQSIENDLAAIFGAPINPPPPIPSSSKSTSAFDSIFL